jgi:hypothetical protein
LNQLRRVTTATAFALCLATCVTACGGSDEPSSGEASTAPAFAPRSADFTLLRRSDIGTHDAVVTFTSRTDGKTSASVDFYVPRTEKTRDDVYPVSLQEGICSSLGETTTSLGDLSAGITVVVLEESFDDAVEPLRGGGSSLVILTPDKKTVAWCGPSS